MILRQQRVHLYAFNGVLLTEYSPENVPAWGHSRQTEYRDPTLLNAPD